MKAATLGLVLIIGAACVGCGEDACVDRGSVAYHQGTASWTGTLVPPGTAPEIVEVDDITVNDGSNDCTESGIEFTVRVGACLLWAQVTRFGDYGVKAFVEPNQVCALSQGTITTDFQGSLDLTSRGQSNLTISGVASGGSLVWTFQGD